MRAVGMFASACAALNCAGWATGSVPQSLFAPEFIWMWWIGAGVWAFCAVAFIFWKPS